MTAAEFLERARVATQAEVEQLAREVAESLLSALGKPDFARSVAVANRRFLALHQRLEQLAGSPGGAA